MKTITAYHNVKSFSERLESINTSLRTDAIIGQLNSAKDLFASIESLKLYDSVQSIISKFEIEEKIEPTGHAKEMYSTWINLLHEQAHSLKMLSEGNEETQRLLETALCVYSGVNILSAKDVEVVKESANLMLKAAKMFSEQFGCLKHTVLILELTIIPKLSPVELKPEIEIPQNLN
ncbi:hypothetical protein CVU83_00260 [Candidatus Falkowbacteria bacterium HGW-Falkowbacteria-2]|uniref:Uncharacterized protein n=1 Tax=Candidatus Falkowbacteria bacterium HGW-Falkowbacteria-2 TaxID=2013769 RepID=A0A2N2E3N5_9BACT|nr:MAG: hypothetical protein CVU83_00260 [Candidatus Falkowbacteria bacterium HGW-Falkowbacteria-2]